MKNIKVLVYFPGNIDEPKGTPIRVRNIINQLLKNNFDVYYCGPKIPKGFNESKFLQMGGRYKRIFIISKFCRTNFIDLVYIQTSAGLWLAPFLKVLTRSKIGLDYHSLLVEEERVYKNLNIFSYTFYKYLDYLLSYFLDFATGVSYKLGDYYKSVLSNYHVLPGGVDTNIFNENVLPNKELLDWKNEGTLIGYAGNTKWYQGLELVLESLNNLNKNYPNKFKIFIIASSLEDSIKDYIHKHKLNNVVKILGKQDHLDIPSLLMSADILTIVRPSDMVTEYAFPSKFPEYLALGKAVVFSRVGDIEKYVSDGISASVINPSNYKELYDKLLELQNSSLRDRIKHGALRVVNEKLDINIVGQNLSNFLKKYAYRK